MREHVQISGLLWLGLSLSLASFAASPLDRSRSRDKSSAAIAQDDEASLGMSPGIVCRSIDGYEDYEPLPARPRRPTRSSSFTFARSASRTNSRTDSTAPHLVPDFQVRRRGEKAIIFQKKKMFEYKPKERQPVRSIYMKAIVALKDSASNKRLPPGEYDLTIILHDEIAKCPPATQVVKFTVIPADDPQDGQGERVRRGEKSALMRRTGLAALCVRFRRAVGRSARSRRVAWPCAFDSPAHLDRRATCTVVRAFMSHRAPRTLLNHVHSFSQAAAFF